jgi:hypothetical protein
MNGPPFLCRSTSHGSELRRARLSPLRRRSGALVGHASLGAERSCRSRPVLPEEPGHPPSGAQECPDDVEGVRSRHVLPPLSRLLGRQPQRQLRRRLVPRRRPRRQRDAVGDRPHLHRAEHGSAGPAPRAGHDPEHLGPGAEPLQPGDQQVRHVPHVRLQLGRRRRSAAVDGRAARNPAGRSGRRGHVVQPPHPGEPWWPQYEQHHGPEPLRKRDRTLPVALQHQRPPSCLSSGHLCVPGRRSSA